MADSRVQLQVEDWVRREWLPGQFKQYFRREHLCLTADGVFDYDAVSATKAIAVDWKMVNGCDSGVTRIWFQASCR